MSPSSNLLNPGQLLHVDCLLDVDQATLSLGGKVGLFGVKKQHCFGSTDDEILYSVHTFQIFAQEIRIL